MADQMKVEVLRTLNGGEFEPGDTRTLDKADAERLRDTGAVKILGSAKAESVPAENKMDAAPSNKAAAKPITKKAT